MNNHDDSSMESILLQRAGHVIADLSVSVAAHSENAAQIAQDQLLARGTLGRNDDPYDISSVYHDFVRKSLIDESNSDEFSRLAPERLGAFGGLNSLDSLMQTISQVGERQRSLSCLPNVDDEVFGFHLTRKLGEGAFARVFLAEQVELADRPVVLKLSPIEGAEPQTLAQLQHTNIVPIYSVHEDPSAGLRAVCMPFLGEASLSQVLQLLWNTTPLPMNGSQLVDALMLAQSSTKKPDKESLQEEQTTNDSGSQTPLKQLRRLNYVQASAWIVSRLAEGLGHAHDRRVLHRDVKPSNVLLSSDGEPLLLDFNLAHAQLDGAIEASVGGTASYMAPEHLRALIGRTESLAQKVDHRADIYSLGMLLFEMLTGHRPFDQSGSYSAMLVQIEAMATERSRVTPSLRTHRADIPWSLESITRKCLAPDPDQRYQQAGHLAEDLRCFLDDRPLKHAPELSWVERARKWTRRHPRLTYSGSVAVIAGLALMAVGTVLNSVHGSLVQTRVQLQTAQAEDRREAFETGTTRALCLVNTTVPLQNHLREGITVCEETLNFYGFLGANKWREPIDWLGLEAAERNRLAEDARELLLLLAAARAQVNPDESVALHEALQLLDRAENIPLLPPSKALWLDRARYWTRLGETLKASNSLEMANQITPATSRDHYLLATAYAREGGRLAFAKAIAELDEAIRLDPRHYWSWTQRGVCHFELGDRLLAAADFGYCTGLWPEFAWGYFNRGRVLDDSGKKLEAARDYSAAIQRDPEFAAAYMNRGLAYLELGRHADALADFNAVRKFGKSDATLLASQGMALEALGRHDEADEAFRTALEEEQSLPTANRLRLLWAYGFSVSTRRPEEARRAFQAVLTDDSENLQALYGLAMLSMTRDERDEALEFFNRALKTDSDFIEARRYRAVLLARIGQLDRASQDINRCLEKEPTVGATLYAAACVASRAAERISDPQVNMQALDLLRRAFVAGVAPDKAKTDPDLAEIRRHPLFPDVLSNPSQTY